MISVQYRCRASHYIRSTTWKRRAKWRKRLKRNQWLQASGPCRIYSPDSTNTIFFEENSEKGHPASIAEKGNLWREMKGGGWARRSPPPPARCSPSKRRKERQRRRGESRGKRWEDALAFPHRSHHLRCRMFHCRRLGVGRVRHEEERVRQMWKRTRKITPPKLTQRWARMAETGERQMPSEELRLRLQL
jgi:hypothetical protein